MVSELILKYMTQEGRGLYRFANLSKKNNFALLKRKKKQLSTNVLRTSTTHYYFARLTSVKI